MHISSNFDGGNIEVVHDGQSNPVRLRIRPDAGGDHFQWFYFRVTGAAGVPLTLIIENASEASYPKGWEDYEACVSDDRAEWQRAETAYDGRCLTIRHTPSKGSVWFAYFAPYSLERHYDLLAQACLHPDVEYQRLGATVDGRDLDLLRVGGAASKKKVWMIARQHPGESMAEWLVEGFLESLLDDGDPMARRLREASTVYVVPNMNPDGTVRGHLRNNAAGQNLNRAWQAPSLEHTPEVAAVRRMMEATGVDAFVDVHGDEALPYNFVAGAEGIPSWTEGRAARQGVFKDELLRASPDFQVERGYPTAAPGKANMAMATNWVAERFGCLAVTLEQPFKDTADSPRAGEGWSPRRARHLGRALVAALASTSPWAAGPP